MRVIPRLQSNTLNLLEISGDIFSEKRSRFPANSVVAASACEVKMEAGYGTISYVQLLMIL